MPKKLVKSQQLVGGKSTKQNRPKEEQLSKGAESYLQKLEEERWARVSRILKEGEERRNREAEEKLKPKPKYIPTKEQEKQLSELEVEQPNLVEWLRTLDKEELELYLGREIDYWHESSKSSFPKRALNDFNEIQGWLAKHSREEREAANKSMGEITIMAGSGSSKETAFGKYKSIDFSIASEIDSPIHVDFNRWRFLSSYGYDRGRPTLVEMSPDDFLDYSYPLREDERSEVSIERIKKGVRDGNIFDAPELYVNSFGKATGEHEGRHRATAFKELGIKKMPVVVYDERYNGKSYRLQEPSLTFELLKDYEEAKEKRWNK
jgi:hypothetical protein